MLPDEGSTALVISSPIGNWLLLLIPFLELYTPEYIIAFFLRSCLDSSSTM
jgi:hypothetical protein